MIHFVWCWVSWPQETSVTMHAVQTYRRHWHEENLVIPTTQKRNSHTFRTNIVMFVENTSPLDGTQLYWILKRAWNYNKVSHWLLKKRFTVRYDRDYFTSYITRFYIFHQRLRHKIKNTSVLEYTVHETKLALPWLPQPWACLASKIKQNSGTLA